MSSVVRLAHPSVALGPAVEAFLDDRDLADTTHRVYKLTLGALTKDLGAEAEVATISRDDLWAFLRRRHGGAAPKTWNRVVATLGSFFAYCARLGWVGVSPAVGLERRRERADRTQVGRTRAIPLEELEAFLSAPHHALRERLLWRMLYETAARAQELLLLDVEDLDLAKKRAVVIGKGGNAEPIGWETATPGCSRATCRVGGRARCSWRPSPRPRLANRRAPTRTRGPAADAFRTAGRRSSSVRPPVGGRCTSCATAASPTWPRPVSPGRCSWPRAATGA